MAKPVFEIQNGETVFAERVAVRVYRFALLCPQNMAN